MGKQTFTMNSSVVGQPFTLSGDLFKVLTKISVKDGASDVSC
jgi:hypothetical protein